LAQANCLISNGTRINRFVTPQAQIKMVIEFHDRYTSRGFWFVDETTGRRFCLSSTGESDQNCASAFTGALAVVHYFLRSRSASPSIMALREHVRTIDFDDHLEYREPFDRTMEIKGGVVTDIQAFGYTAKSDDRLRPEATKCRPWSYFRQDLYFSGCTRPFLLIHWRHTLDAIRILDIIPGDDTRQII
jgi:hypothetical protein